MSMRKKDSFPGILIGGSLVAAWYLGFAGSAAIILAGLFFYFSFRAISKSSGDRLRRNLESYYGVVVAQHRTTLARKRSILEARDDYGNLQSERWQRELVYFHQKVVIPAITANLPAFVVKDMIGVATDDLFVAWFARTDPVPSRAFDDDTDIAALTPLTFEAWCRERLESLGWTARTTVASGDQGADVLADFGTERLVVQCKLYSSAIGNKAVQEVAAARQYYAANIAAVVTNQDYTRSARDLAARTDVMLLHTSEMSRLSRLSDTR